jgi:LPXTG-site transpeptidase (sortase) family protein
MKIKNLTRKNFLKALVLTLKLLAIAILFYLLFLPLYPEIKYRLISQSLEDSNNNHLLKNNLSGQLPESDYAVSEDRLIISKIGINAPIVETNNEKYGLSLGAWLVPEGSTPTAGGNTIITGHRFRYLPPSNLTFYLFHKLELGDTFYVIWRGDYYFYQIKEIKIVDPWDSSVYNQSSDPILTLYTCHPIYSTEKRLVVISDLMEKKTTISED